MYGCTPLDADTVIVVGAGVPEYSIVGEADIYARNWIGSIVDVDDVEVDVDDVEDVLDVDVEEVDVLDVDVEEVDDVEEEDVDEVLVDDIEVEGTGVAYATAFPDTL